MEPDVTPSDWNVPENVTKVVILFRKDGRQMYVERDAGWLDRLKAENEQRLSELETALREIVDVVEDIARRALGGGE